MSSEINAEIRKMIDKTAHLSSSAQALICLEFKAVIRLGEDAIVPLFIELNGGKGCMALFSALQTLCRANPVPQEFAGQISYMRDYWLAWGRNNGYFD